MEWRLPGIEVEARQLQLRERATDRLVTNLRVASIGSHAATIVFEPMPQARRPLLAYPTLIPRPDTPTCCNPPASLACGRARQVARQVAREVGYPTATTTSSTTYLTVPARARRP